MRRILPILANATLALALAGPVLAQGKAQTVCPVRGDEDRQKCLHRLPGQAHLLLLTELQQGVQVEPLGIS